MKKTLLFSLAIGLILSSCGSKTDSGHAEHEMDHSSDAATKSSSLNVANSESTTLIIDSYLAVKDALVSDDLNLASSKSKDLVAALNSYDIANSKANDPEELERLQVEAAGMAEKIAIGDIAAQRENFQALSVTMKDLLKIAGTDRTLYHQYCPMYKNNTGGMWLSASEDIKNPLFGSSMLTCGRVEETIAMN